jgi:GTPase SAR1 family protein|nr:MAG TPA: AAA domain protein [Caudoviricetes sp.]
MGKYGKKNSVDLNPLHYNIAFLGEGGIGKTTLCYQMCEKLVGDEGYMHFDIGKEDGADAIEGVVTEKIENWDKFEEVIDDIVENKETDYPHLQVIIIDTYDELIPMAEDKAVRIWNKRNSDKKAETINGAWNGFGKGQDKAAELILNNIWRFKSVNVHPIIIFHVKRSDIIDPITQTTYSKLTADAQQRYFNAIKNKMHFVGFAYIDRDIINEKTGRKDIKGKDITTNKVMAENRVISFRDNNYSVDSKSRFADIVDKIPFDVDAFIKAMQDAILAEKSKSGKSEAEIKKEQSERDKAAAIAAAEYSKSAKTNKIDLDRNEEIIAEIKSRFTDATEEIQSAIKSKMIEVGLKNFKDTEVPTASLEAVLAVLG